jgi:mRNA-degrading endonuclease HigB of HigAB toxin-antitoxin module
MKSTKKIFFSAIIMAAAIASMLFSKFNHLEKPISSFTREITKEYFPTDSSLKLVYNSSFGEASAVIKKKNNSYIMDLRNDDFFFVQTIQVKNDTIYLTKLDQEVDVFLFISAGSSITYNRPYLRYPFPLNINDNWHWNGVEYIDEKDPDTISVSGKVLGEELIKTEAGNFDCVKFQIDIRKKKSGTHTKFYEWRTPKIGLVKLEAFIDSNGFIGTVMSLLGYDEMKFELKKIG